MPQAQNGEIVLEYDTIGNAEDRALLLVMGWATQMTAWDLDFCKLLADEGFFVIRYDNRDVGLSSKTLGVPPGIAELMTAVFAGGELPEVPYTLTEMAVDGMAVLDAVGVEEAHIVGASMGGMIVQMMAIEHPQRVLSMTSIMSTTGRLGVGMPTGEAMAALTTPLPEDRETAIERGVEIGRLMAGPHFDEKRAREWIAESFDRSFSPSGIFFQLAAIAATGDRTEQLEQLDLPTLVIHGDVDPLVTSSGGEATANAIAGAKLVTFADMGHDLPVPRWPEIVEEITANAARAA